MPDAIGERLVFIGGAPRSGTTFVQLLLNGTGCFETAQETHLFAHFVDPLIAGYRRSQKAREKNPEWREVGLHTLLSEEAFIELVRDFARGALSRIGDGDRLVLEKTPSNIWHWGIIFVLFPSARIIHVIRDPRAVVASIMAARPWAAEWAHQSVEKLAGLWTQAVTAGLDAARAHPERVFAASYERLRCDGAVHAAELFDWLGIPVGDTAALLESVTIDRLRSGAVRLPWSAESEPPEFYRSGEIGAWRRELSTLEIAQIEAVAGDLMAELGYEIACIVRE